MIGGLSLAVVDVELLNVPVRIRLIGVRLRVVCSTGASRPERESSVAAVDVSTADVSSMFNVDNIDSPDSEYSELDSEVYSELETTDELGPSPGYPLVESNSLSSPSR